MDYRAFEQRLLDTIFTTDVQLTPAAIAFLYKIQVAEAADLLQQAAVAGLLNIESDEEGNILYTYPNRIKLPPRQGAEGRAGERPGLSNGGTYGRRDALGGRADQSGRGTEGALAIRVDNRGAATALAIEQHGGEATAVVVQTQSARELSREADFDRLPSLAVDSLPADPSGAYSDGRGDYAHFGPQGAQAGGDAMGAPGHARCPFCNEQIVQGAKKCKHCHEYLDYALRDIHARQGGINQISVALTPVSSQNTALTQWTGTQAALLSLFMPGLGQMCSGRVPAGLLWMMFTIMGYLCFIVPGLILHVLCVSNAYRLPRQAQT